VTQPTVYEAMSTLRAVRRLKPDPIPTAVLERVLQAATWAPTGANRQPWRIILVTDPAPKKALGELYSASWYQYANVHQAHIGDVPEAVRAREMRTLAAGNYLADHFHETPAIAVFCFNPKNMAITDAKLDRISVVGGGSIYPAVQNLLLACRAEGLGCVLTTLLCQHEPKVREILGIPDPWGTAAAVPMGYPVATGHGPIRRRATKDLVYANHWGTPRA
jgi:nitroreductase